MNTVVIIAGPTASGKTDLAIQAAKQFNTSIISADSRQCFKELNIGVAKPSVSQLSAVHHYFINTHHITETVTAADFEKYALEAANEIFQKNEVAVMCGGTGLYIKAFCEGLDPIPPVPEEIRESVAENYTTGGITWLQERIKETDPLFFEKGEMQNPQRMMRALEVMEATGKSVLSYFSEKKPRDFNIIKLAIGLPREELYDRINRRVDLMEEAGLKEEVRDLIPYKHLNALQTVGYSELFDFFDGKISEEKAVDLIKQHTRNYAKRQVTWFKKEGFTWIDANSFPTDLHEMVEG